MTEPVDQRSSGSALPSTAPRGFGATCLNRRHALLGGAALLTSGGRNAMAATPAQMQGASASASEQLFTSQPSLVVAGADTGPMAVWANRLGAVIDGMLPAGTPLRLAYVGGPDGVTAANQFEARTSPDGSTGLVISGAPAIAWLTGDPRAQFDAGHWLPVVTGLASGVVLRGRAEPAPAPAPGPAGAQRHRLASNGSGEIALAAALGLSLLGIETRLVGDVADPLAALLSGRVDLIFLHGPFAVELAIAAQKAGAIPLFTLGYTDDAGNLTRDPLMSAIPTLPEALALKNAPSARPALLAAWRAVAAAAQLEFALVLPWLTPAGTVAWWRKAVTPITAAFAGDAPIRSAAQSTAKPQLQLHADPTGNFGLSKINVDADTSLALKSWISAYKA